MLARVAGWRIGLRRALRTACLAEGNPQRSRFGRRDKTLQQKRTERDQADCGALCNRAVTKHCH
jgi:hypothetical protein